ncbi:MAG: glycosyl hydrolase [Planctomycetota bacterium]
MIRIDDMLTPEKLMPKIHSLWDLSARKILLVEQATRPGDSAPVFTVEGKYRSRGWTEWTLGFQFGASLLQFDATGDREFLELGRNRTFKRMADHVTHFGVHDHGFNIVSTHGNLLRLMREGRVSDQDRQYVELALRVSGAVQARRWTRTATGLGYIYSFNGPHSLFADTIRSLRSLALAHQLGHEMLSERDERISLFERLIEHALTTARFNVYYGEGRDSYDVPGRVAHESLFNTNDGQYRCPSTQQGYSPFTTWTRGLAWIMCGYAEQLEYLESVPASHWDSTHDRDEVLRVVERAALVTCDFYIENTPTCGVPYWDTGAPGLVRIPEYLSKPADPFNVHEPVDSSAAAIACQALLRMGLREQQGEGGKPARRYLQAGLTVLQSLLNDPYLSTRPDHQGLLLHAVYHRPNGWDHVPPGRTVPSGESCMWGDYHLREAALLVQRLAKREPHLRFYTPAS